MPIILHVLSGFGILVSSEGMAHNPFGPRSNVWSRALIWSDSMDRGRYERFSNPSDHIDVACAKFANLLKSGIHPKIDDYVARWEEPERTKLISQLCACLNRTSLAQGRKTQSRGL